MISSMSEQAEGASSLNNYASKPKKCTTFPCPVQPRQVRQQKILELVAVPIRPRDAGLEGLAEMKLLTPPEPLAKPTMP